MDVSPGALDLARGDVRIAGHSIGPRATATNTTRSPGASDGEVNRRGIHRSRDSEQRANSGADADDDWPAVFGSSRRAGH